MTRYQHFRTEHITCERVSPEGNGAHLTGCLIIDCPSERWVLEVGWLPQAECITSYQNVCTEHITCGRVSPDGNKAHLIGCWVIGCPSEMWVVEGGWLAQAESLTIYQHFCTEHITCERVLSPDGNGAYLTGCWIIFAPSEMCVVEQKIKEK